MREVLIGSPAVAFACGITASPFRAVSGGPSTGSATPKRPPVAPLLLAQRSALGLLGAVGAGTSPTEWCVSVACRTLSTSRTRGSTRQGERASPPLAEAKGLAGPLSVSGRAARVEHGHPAVVHEARRPHEFEPPGAAAEQAPPRHDDGGR